MVDGKHIFSIHHQTASPRRRSRRRALIATRPNAARRDRRASLQVLRQVFEFRKIHPEQQQNRQPYKGCGRALALTYLLVACSPAGTWRSDMPGTGCGAIRPPRTFRPPCTRTPDFCTPVDRGEKNDNQKRSVSEMG